MKTRILSKVYRIVERDETGLIPAKTGSVLIDYDEEGNPLSVHYSPRYPKFSRQGESDEKLVKKFRRIKSEHDSLLKKLPLTQEEIECVVDLVERKQ